MCTRNHALVCALSFLASPFLSAQDALWPGVAYAADVPTFEEVLGHAPGERIVSHAQILEYLEALETARPRQLRLFEYARSWEGRALVYAVVGSESNLARLDEIRANRQRLADPRETSEAEAQALIASEPAITWLAYGALIRARIDPDHWLTSGSSETVNALVQGRSIYAPLTLDKGRNPVIFTKADENVASGHVWQENREQLAFKPLVMVQEHGRGRAIGFTADPNFRAYLDGLNLLFVNAVFRGPAH